MKNKIIELPEDFEHYTPLLKFIDHNTEKEILGDDLDELSEPFNKTDVQHFFNCVQQVTAGFERGFNDFEIIEIRLFNDKNETYWTYKRKNIFDNNRFGDIRKALEDFSGIKCKVRPKNSNRTQFAIVIN